MSDGLMIALCLATVVTDSRWHRIPNWLTLPTMGLGLLVNTIEGGWGGFVRALMGAVLALGLTVPLFVLGAIKAGDVKLVTAWGAVKGAASPPLHSFALWAFLYGALIGGLWALVALAQARSVPSAGRRMREMVTSLVLTGRALSPSAGERSALRQPMPYGVALSLGALMALACEWLWGVPFPPIVG